MNGPQHYAEAERLLEKAEDDFFTEPDRYRDILAAAQVHATLALAAASAMAPSGLPADGDTAGAWRMAVTA